MIILLLSGYALLSLPCSYTLHPAFSLPQLHPPIDASQDKQGCMDLQTQVLCKELRYLICSLQSLLPASVAIWRKVLNLTDMLEKWTWLRNDVQQLPKGRGIGAESFHHWPRHCPTVLLASKYMSEPTNHAQFAFHKLKCILCFLTFYFQSSFGHNLA